MTLFVGKVRDHDAGKGVRGLDYSAHPTALDRLREVCDRVAARHEVHGVAAVHRIGQLEIGDLAVVVATLGGAPGPGLRGLPRPDRHPEVRGADLEAPASSPTAREEWVGVAVGASGA